MLGMQQYSVFYQTVGCALHGKRWYFSTFQPVTKLHQNFLQSRMLMIVIVAHDFFLFFYHRSFSGYSPLTARVCKCFRTQILNSLFFIPVSHMLTFDIWPFRIISWRGSCEGLPSLSRQGWGLFLSAPRSFSCVSLCCLETMLKGFASNLKT